MIESETQSEYNRQQLVWVQEPTVQQPVRLCIIRFIGKKKSFEFHQNDYCILWGTMSDGQMQSYTFLVQLVWVQEPTVQQHVRLGTIRFIGKKKVLNFTKMTIESC